MNYLSTDTEIIDRSMESISFGVSDAAAIRCTVSSSAFRDAENESRLDTLRPFKGLIVTALFSLPFWMSLALLLLR
jgi:hypothetical protein